jgi:cyclohexadieny/prephenate dehydrogenase
MTSREPLFERMALIGLGLLGSSLARVAKRDGLVGHIAGSTRSRATLERAFELGFLDSIHETPAEAVKEADLIVLCAPVGANADIAAAIADHLRPGAIVTDVGSVKQAIVRDVGPHIPSGVHLVPGHPVAGTEKSGPDHGFAELFEDRYCILTPPPGTDEAAVEKVAALWRLAGSRVEVMDPDHHDRVLAITSHLPHLIAYTIVGTASNLENQLLREDSESGDLVRTREVIRYSAGGFRDFTRIAASPKCGEIFFLIIERRSWRCWAGLQRILSDSSGRFVGVKVKNYTLGSSGPERFVRGLSRWDRPAVLILLRRRTLMRVSDYSWQFC